MQARAAWAAAAVVAATTPLAAAAALHRLSPAPTAQTSLGSDEAFGRGLHLREIAGMPARLFRWTTDRAEFSFHRLPPGPADLQVRIRGHRTAVAVAANGVVVGVIEPGRFVGRYALEGPVRGTVAVELRTDGFGGRDGRPLGALLERVRVTPSPAPFRPPLSLALLLLAPALGAGVAAAVCGFGPGGAAAFAVLVAGVEALLLLPFGLARSEYASTLARLLALGSVVGCGFARWQEARRAGSGRGAFCALLAAWLVLGVAATSPVMVVSDAVFHANNLDRVAAGDLLLTSLTQHEPPVRFPYGVSFYLFLWPLYAAGLDPVGLVRWGAAAGALVASAALFGILSRVRAGPAALAVVILQLMPGSFDLFSYGNLSNVFAQSAATVFFAWWAGGAKGGWLAGAALVVVGGVGHLSTFVVLLVLAPALVLAERGGGARPRGLAAVGAGLALCVLYYAQFLGLAREQLPRLAAGEAGGAGGGVVAALAGEAGRLLREWGWPVLALSALGWPRPAGGSLDRQLIALWASGLLLLVVAVATPLDVRYAYAVAPAVAAAAASGCLVLGRAGTVGRMAAVVLIGAQAVLAGRNLAAALFERYRG